MKDREEMPGDQNERGDGERRQDHGRDHNGQSEHHAHDHGPSRPVKPVRSSGGDFSE